MTGTTEIEDRLDVTAKGLVVREMIDDLMFEELQSKTGAKLVDKT